ncbi:MAG: hypothetical protein L6Q98_14310 [Anaerolineae bacterium]|nr:hypothetical protein [Anaerolineae bacterium]NUQ04811.1 hypothetical protein [Anaerolineae bacterium]
MSIIGQLVQDLLQRKGTVDVLIRLVQKLIIMLIYYVEKDDRIKDWKENPLSHIYHELSDLKAIMRETDTHSLPQEFLTVETQFDETIHTWHQQRLAGIAENERVVLNADQRLVVEQQMTVELQVTLKKQALEHAFVEGRANRNGSLFSSSQMEHLIPA